MHLTHKQEPHPVKVCKGFCERAQHEPRDPLWCPELCLWLRLRNQTVVLTVEEPTVTKTKEGASGQGQNQEHAAGFFDICRAVHH